MAAASPNSNSGIPPNMVQRWTRPPASCKACRKGKRRCDRAQPCSNCTLRGMPCEYEGKELELAPEEFPHHVGTEPSKAVGFPQSGDLILPAIFDSNDMVNRINKLEDAVFTNRSTIPATDPHLQRYPALSQDLFGIASSIMGGVPDTVANTSRWTPIELSVPTPPNAQVSVADLMSLSRHLPPISQALDLVDHFVRCMQPTFGVFHVPSTRALVEQTYQSMLKGEEPSATDLALLFSIFSAAALTWTPELLQKVRATPAVAQASFISYTNLAISLSEPVPPSTVALEAISLLIHTLTIADGFSDKVHHLRSRAFLMARAMLLHRLDTPQSQEARRREGCDEIEIEVQRRIWWNMAASDWLLSFTGGPQEGTYLFHPRHMNVRYPRNMDDEFITATSDAGSCPISTPTSVSYMILRLHLAEICREVVDALPSVLLEPEELDYEVIYGLNARFQDFANGLPSFFQLDSQSIQESQAICNERPYIPWQRTTLNFSINTYICRLHRPFHLQGSSNPTYAFSRMICVRSAHAVLELRHSMDDIGDSVGLNALRLWTVAQHVFLAAVILATEVSFDSGAPLVEIRKAEVLEACKMLKEMRSESKMTRDTIQKGVQTLLSTLESRRPANMGSHKKAPVSHGKRQSQSPTMSTSKELIDKAPYIFTGNTKLSGGLGSEDGEDWDRLWTEISNAAPSWDVPQWSSFLEDIDWTIGPTL